METFRLLKSPESGRSPRDVSRSAPCISGRPDPSCSALQGNIGEGEAGSLSRNLSSVVSDMISEPGFRIGEGDRQFPNSQWR